MERIRRLVSHAFSEQALREQEPLITYYFDLLISRLHQEVSGAQQGKVNLVQWLNFTTFDILGDLCFDESFGALESGRYHIWVTSIFQGLKAARMFRIFRAYPISRQLFSVVRMIVPYASRTRQRHFKFTDEKTEERMHRRTDRKDIMR
ncbi:uncharacterized protein KY384_004794 [Bacidia gigantensis]|uniref:uncharacterized protein n=1 Tax=Bacidia gigantensis TaxID=2732470 RepID=UPI001D05481F|nr:uncharacterized protein KY384_004794 [Bacidia gigantensis]KAG8530292.1 hypothetical protein KY384_004794 [Bacidia gigantensis]